MLVENGIISLFFKGKPYYLDLSNPNHPISEGYEDKKYEIIVNDSMDDDPYFVIFVTDDCNMKCEYCFNSKREKVKLQLEPQYSCNDFVTFLNRNFPNQEVGIRFFGGEPLLNKKWIYKFVYTINDAGIKADYNVFTNATLIDEEFLGFAKEHDFKFYVSVGGGVDRYKGELFGKRISEGINKLVDRKINTVARMVWIPNKEETLTELIEKAFDTGVKVVSFTFEWGKSVLEEELYTEQIEEFVDFYIGKILKHDYRYIGVAPFIRYITKWITNEGYNLFSCAAGRSMYSISTDGKCYPCQCFDRNPDFTAGSISEIQKSVFCDVMPDQIKPCCDCEVRFFCKARCYADAYFSTGSIRKMNASRCKAEKTIIGASAYILSELQKHTKEYNGYKILVERISRSYKD